MASYGPYLFQVPVLDDSDLIYTEAETKEILIFFYPSRAQKISALTIDNQGRAFAQILMMAAVQATVAMSIIEATVKSLWGTAKSKNKSILNLAKRLAKKYGEVWLKNIKKGTTLHDIDIYYIVRDKVAIGLAPQVNAYINGDGDVVMRFLSKPITLHIFA